jgi:hypothetical protein
VFGFLRYSNGMLFLCVVMGVRKTQYLNVFSDETIITHFHAYI